MERDARAGYNGGRMSQAQQPDSPLQSAVTQILRELDPEPHRDGLRDTPRRMEKAFRFYTEGYKKDPRQVIGGEQRPPGSHRQRHVEAIVDTAARRACQHYGMLQKTRALH